jgi:hypothetical protein
MWCDYDSFAVLDIRLKTFQPIGARTREAIEIQDSLPCEHPGDDFFGFEGSVEFPSFVGGIEIVRRDENLEAPRLRRFEDPLHVLDSVVLLKTFVDQWPRKAFLTQHLVLRVDKDHRGVVLVDVHRFPRSRSSSLVKLNIMDFAKNSGRQSASPLMREARLAWWAGPR